MKTKSFQKNQYQHRSKRSLNVELLIILGNCIICGIPWRIWFQAKPDYKCVLSTYLISLNGLKTLDTNKSTESHIGLRLYPKKIRPDYASPDSLYNLELSLLIGDEPYIYRYTENYSRRFCHLLRGSVPMIEMLDIASHTEERELLDLSNVISSLL